MYDYHTWEFGKKGKHLFVSPNHLFIALLEQSYCIELSHIPHQNTSVDLSLSKVIFRKISHLLSAVC